MDMEPQLVFDAELFLLDKDQEICQRLSGDFSPDLSLWDQQLVQKEEYIQETKDIISDIIQYLYLQVSIRDTPMSELISLATSKYILSEETKQRLFRRLRKMKLTQKRVHAKSRGTQIPIVPLLHCKSDIQSCYSNGGSDEETKRQKNRLSAQISRDRKKEYTKRLEKQNEQLLYQRKVIEDENKRLKQMLSVSSSYKQEETQQFSENSGFISLLIMLGIIMLLRLLGNSKNSPKDHKNDLIGLEKITLKQNQLNSVKQNLKKYGINASMQDLSTPRSVLRRTQIPLELAVQIENTKQFSII